MKIYGYARISTKEQNLDRQIDAFMVRGIKEKYVFIDRESGKDFNRVQYKRMIKRIKCGDCIVFKSIDRMGRNYGEILEQWRIITKEKGAHIEILDMPLLNTTTEKEGLTGMFIADLVLQILAYVAETERTFIKQRQKEGIVAAKSRGIQFGRPKIKETTLFTRAYQKWITGKITSREGAELAQMSHSTFYRRCKNLM
ncbi:MAG: recombinase family protein [Lachnospiraceae bacterium]|nr:recombinase family protein [Lachnospiraceae bacterium]